MADRFFLSRFKNAQDNGLEGAETYAKALAEVRGGRKVTHWMWYVFPQVRGFGHSENTWFYGITSLDEARAYLEDEVLGSRLREITQALLDQPSTDLFTIFEFDWMKVAASMTLFDYVSPDDVFGQVIDKFLAGSHHPQTLEIIRSKKRF